MAGTKIKISFEDEENRIRLYSYHDCVVLPRNLQAFYQQEKIDECDMYVEVKNVQAYKESSHGKRIYNQLFYVEKERLVMVVYDLFDSNEPAYSIIADKDYSHITYIPHSENYNHYDLQWLMYPFEGRMLYQQGIVLHGAAMEYNGQGIIFSGVSGAGKSTQAHLWQKYRNALIINGDCPVIRIEDDIVKVEGTPWCGSSGESINRKVPLQAVVIVSQGTENKIRTLQGKDKFYAVFSNVLRSNFDERCMDLALKNVAMFIDSIQVYELTCTISEQAVETLEWELSKIGTEVETYGNSN